MNRCKVPETPPLLIDNKYVIDCGVTKCNDFTQQCNPNINNSVLSHLEMLTETRICTIEIT